MTIRSRIPSEEYKANFDSIFRKDVTDSPESSTEVSVVPEGKPDDNMLEVSGKGGGT